jgi:hypothetical protein
MAKKKPSISLIKDKLVFIEKGITYKLIHFKSSDMTIEVQRYENETFIDNFTLPFAHLPKKLKKIIKSN